VPTVATTYVAADALIVVGAVYVTEQKVKVCALRVQLGVPSVPAPPLEPLAVFESA
jgi:hypothetical protein